MDSQPVRPEIQWFHSFQFADGSVIDGLRPTPRLRAEADLVFKHSVVGKSVLEIGAWDGFFSFEAEKRGAARVHATDHFCWSGPGWGTKVGFDYVHQKLKSKVEATDVDVFDLSPDRHGTYDTVLFLGVLYHLKNPLGGLELVHSLTRECAVIETQVDSLDVKSPVMRFYLGSELNNDPTNFWAPNVLCLDRMLREVGFRKVVFTSVDGHVTPAGEVIETGSKKQLVRTRVIAHAWR